MYVGWILLNKWTAHDRNGNAAFYCIGKITLLCVQNNFLLEKKNPLNIFGRLWVIYKMLDSIYFGLQGSQWKSRLKYKLIYFYKSIYITLSLFGHSLILYLSLFPLALFFPSLTMSMRKKCKYVSTHFIRIAKKKHGRKWFEMENEWVKKNTSKSMWNEWKLA